MTYEHKARVQYDVAAPGIVQVRVAGELGLGSIPSLRTLLAQLLQEGYARLVIDLTEATYIASAGIGAFISYAEEAKALQGEVILAGAQPKVRHVFDVMGLGRVLRFAANADEALTLLKPTA